ncbi:GT4 family glycosyltransferase PelF [Actinomadura terrae]|uniref:GT4 family glycosyltransferase PelF n=1 Tax=Actinomadura terrae TaxID=604353 RepID=UPI001FA807DF|nr:GT4 family glycosyltransferase PelF [Actinomadura terrae]
MTEGTYPHSFGGVSVWCDQLVRGMPEHAFNVLAITASGSEPVVWDLPGHVTAESVPMWGPPGGRPPSGGLARRFEKLCRAFLHAILAPSGPEAEVFPHILRGLFEFGREADLQAAMRMEGPVRWLMDEWAAHKEEYERIGVRPSVHDALTTIDLLEHQLRPLMRPAPVGDVTHAVSNGIPVLPCLAAKWTYQTPLCLTEHGIYLRERYIGFGRSPYAWPVKAALLGFMRLLCSAGYRAADLVTPSNLYNQRWQIRCGADPENMETVYNGVDPDAFPAAGAEPAVPTISWAGRVDPIKDLETLIRAFALVAEKMPETRLRMFGGTPKGGEKYRTRCEALAADLGVADRAIFEGRVDDIRDAYAAGSVVVLSSISEGFPYTLIEAMTCGRATVATNVGGVTEAVADTGLVVPPRDPEAMAEACLRLLGDEVSRRRLGHAARDRALELFTVDRAVDAFRAIYSGLAEPGPSGTRPAEARLA